MDQQLSSETTQSSKDENRKALLTQVLAELQSSADLLKAHKKGPSKPEAIERVKYNARRHGFTGQVLLLTPEEQPLYDAFVAGMMVDFAPVGTNETFLANSIAEEAWRLQQIRAYCSNLTAVGAYEGAGSGLKAKEGCNHQIEDAVADAAIARDRAKEFSLMSLYMQRTQRACEKYKKELREVQAERKAREAAELEEARLLYQLAEIQGLTYNPAEDGFVFSLAKVKAYTQRFHRLNQSKKLDLAYQKKHNPIEIPRAAAKAA
jgi:hypothetical protein